MLSRFQVSTSNNCELEQLMYYIDSIVLSLVQLHCHDIVATVFDKFVGSRRLCEVRHWMSIEVDER
jgi:hypothetical protein